jgi:hypothetical protein
VIVTFLRYHSKRPMATSKRVTHKGVRAGVTQEELGWEPWAGFPVDALFPRGILGFRWTWAANDYPSSHRRQPRRGEKAPPRFQDLPLCTKWVPCKGLAEDASRSSVPSLSRNLSIPRDFLQRSSLFSYVASRCHNAYAVEGNPPAFSRKTPGTECCRHN